MIVLAGIITASPADIDKLADDIRTMVTASNAEEGCHGYSFAQDLNDAGTIRVFECWESDAALAEHFKTPHMATFQAAMTGVTVTGMDIKKYEISGVAPFTGAGN
ncbi:MAG: putative quinol monooxygenase [Alphaproteobacteria bacterium]